MKKKADCCDVSIIIVNYNTKQLTSNCIESIFSKTKNVSFEVILIDNASTDGSKEFFEKDNRIKYIYSHENLGFGRANNIGIKYAIGDYFFLLNSDTYLLNNAVEFFFNFAQQNTDKHSIYGTWLINNNKERIHSYGQFPTIKTELCNALRVYTARIPFIKKYNSAYKEYFTSDTLEVDFITGADLFIPRLVINKCGMFDPHFFMYYEEGDLQKRMEEKGISRTLINGPQIVHLCKFHKKESMSKRLNSTKGMLVYIKKYYRKNQYIIFKVLYFVLRFFPTILCKDFNFREKTAYLNLIIKE